MTDQQPAHIHPGAFCSVPGATGTFKTGRAGVCSAKEPGARLRWRASGPPPEKKKARSRRAVLIPAQQILQLPTLPEAPLDAPAAVLTWEELGKPEGPPPVGQVVGYMGGTYERLPGTPRRYRVISVDGRDISSKTMSPAGYDQTAFDVRSNLRVDALDHARRVADHASQWRRTLGDVTGSWNYDTGAVDGFDTATPAEQEAIRSALSRWTGDKINGSDASRIAEPRVNTALRGAAPLDGVAAADVAALDHAFTMSRTKKPITVYRGFSNGSHILPDGYQGQDLTGMEWSPTGFTPTTADETVADEYAGQPEDRGFAIRMHLPKGFPAIAVPDAVGGLDNEGEIVLPRKLQFRVTKDNGVQAGGQRWLDVDVTLAPQEPAAQEQRPGWSKAARGRAARRFGRAGQSNPLGARTGGGAGHTEYTDTEFGGGRTQIWDKS